MGNCYWCGKADTCSHAPPEPKCPGCAAEIDPSVCGCGEPERGHLSPFEVGHNFIPMGCNCLRGLP
jgi:hypothetical protein